jgi:hypothetical protein
VSDLLPPPAAPQHAPTAVVGQQIAPSSAVPMGAPAGMVTTQAGKTNDLAVISLIAGIGSFFANVIPGVGGATVAIVAIITGYMARNQIKQTGEQGYGMATAGMIIGFVHLGIIAVVVLLVILAFLGVIALVGISSSHSG